MRKVDGCSLAHRSGALCTVAGAAAAGGGIVPFKYFTLESVFFSSSASYARSFSIFLPAVPFEDLQRILSATVLAMYSGGTRTRGSNTAQ
jgi:hypothetical protein